MCLLFTLAYRAPSFWLVWLRMLLALGLVHFLVRAFAYSVGPEPAQLRRVRRLFGLAMMLGVLEFALCQEPLWQPVWP